MGAVEQLGGGWWGTSLHARHALVLFRSIMFCALRGCRLFVACFMLLAGMLEAILHHWGN
jgi:hypothetical protein